MIMDFSKAFDKAAHYRLLTNLTAMESRGRLLAGSRTSSQEGPNVSYLRGKFLARSWSALRKERWAYKSYVHPKLGYATIVHDPPPPTDTHTHKDKQAGMVPAGFLTTITTAQACQTCSPNSAGAASTWVVSAPGQWWCTKFMVYKIYNGLVTVNTTQLLVHPQGIAASAYPHLFIRPASSNDLRENSFFPHSVCKWALDAIVGKFPQQMFVWHGIKSFREIEYC